MKKRALFLFLILILLLSACQSAATVEPTLAPTEEVVLPTETPTEAPTEAPEPTEEPSMEPVLELVTPEETIVFTMAELMALPQSQGQAGIKSSTGKITPPTSFTGISLENLIEYAGGISEDMGINVVAEDGYAISFSYDQIMNGSFIPYDPATGEELRGEVDLTAMVAYLQDGEPLDSQRDGDLRLVIISPENNQVTDGHWSVKWVNKVEIRSMVQDWNLSLTGALDAEIDRASFESCINCHTATWTDEMAQDWVGVPLWYILGYVDDAVKHEGPAYNGALAEAGYDLSLTAVDGYEVMLNSVNADRNNEWIVAATVNGNPLPDKYYPLRLVGEGLQKNEMVGQITQISLDVEPVEEIEEMGISTVPLEEAQLKIIGLVDRELGLTEEILRSLEVVEITAEHPKKGEVDYSGVLLSVLLEETGINPEASSVLFTAGDGYSAEVSLTDLRSCESCLISFTETPGDFALVMPGFESNFWVKGLASIEIK